MELEQILKELDSLKFNEIEGYLIQKIEEASNNGNINILIPLMNELIGFYRDTSQFDKGLIYKKQLLAILDAYNQKGTMNYATSLLNIANFDRAMGDYDQSLNEYKICEQIYSSLLNEGDYLWAGLYNNESILFQMMGDNLAAIGELGKALRIVEAIPGKEIEVATTYTGIAQSLAALGQFEEAETNVSAALSIFEKGNNEDYHYSSAAAVMGIIEYNRGEYKKAAAYYDSAAETVRRIMGENENYKLLIANRDAMLSMTITPISNDTSDTDADAEWKKKLGRELIQMAGSGHVEVAEADEKKDEINLSIEKIAELILEALRDTELVKKDEENYYLEKIGRKICGLE